MYILRCIPLIWILPCSWIDAIRIRKKPFEERSKCIAKWGRRLYKSFGITFEVEVEDTLPSDTPILFISNHQSSFDLLMLVVGIPVPFTFVSKVENKKIPFLSSWSKTMDLIYFDREDRTSAISMLRESARRLKSNKNLLIFPEGTRSKGNTMLEMQAGSLQPAFMAKATVVPVVLLNSYNYKDIIKHKGHAKMKLLKPIPYETYKPMKAEGLINVLQESMQHELDKTK